MIRSIATLTACCIGLIACTEGKPLYAPDNVPPTLVRSFADNFQMQAFENGPITVTTVERGDFRHYHLNTCGTNVCGARRGNLQRGPDYAVVSQAYPGRTFFLSPGGDGYMQRHGGNINLVWDNND